MFQDITLVYVLQMCIIIYKYIFIVNVYNKPQLKEELRRTNSSLFQFYR